MYNIPLKEALSATKIGGGIASNIIPDSSFVQINHRYSPGKLGKDIKSKFLELQKKVGAHSFTIIENNPSSDIVPMTNEFLIDFVDKTKNDILKNLSVATFWSGYMTNL